MIFRRSGALLILMAATLVWAQTPSTTSVPAAGGEIVITALGHASVQLEHGGKVITVDPVTNQADLSKAKQADLILVTDIHPDHFDPAAITSPQGTWTGLLVDVQRQAGGRSRQQGPVRLCGGRYGVRARYRDVGKERRRGLHTDESAVHDVAGGGRGMREGV